MRRVRENRRAMGPSSHLSAMRRDVVLRQFAEQTREQAFARKRTSRDRFRATERALVVLLRGRDVL